MNENNKNTNPLLAEFSEYSSQHMTATTVDWEALGVQTPYVIFITGRCGSTLLSNMIKDTQLAGSPDEYFNEGVISHLNKKLQATTFGAYFHEAVKSSTSNGRFGFEIDWYRLRHLQLLIDFPHVFPQSKSAFFYMTRRDIVAQAWSYATAKATGVWHQFADKSGNSTPEEKPILTEESIWREIVLLLEAEMKMELFFDRHSISPTRIDYEMLTSNRRDILAMVLLNIGCTVESIVAAAGGIVDRTNKMPSDNFADILSFRKKYSALLVDTQKVRGSNYDTIRLKLRDSNLYL